MATGRSILRDKRGNVLVLAALLLPVLLAVLGLGFETANWYQVRRAMQNAADSAAVAAATNAAAGYMAEARAVSGQYGFQNGVNNTTVTVSNTAACPSGGANCYSVSITRPVPLLLSKLVGFTGNTLIGGARAEQLTATAVALPGTPPRNYCILALASSGATQGIRTNGAPNADLHGCNVMSNTDAQCNGGNLNAGYGDAHGSSQGCGAQQASNVPVVPDPYARLASNIPSNPCHSYAQTQYSGTLIMTGGAAQKIVCGDMQLTGDLTLSTDPAGGVLVIENGKLDTNGYTIKTASGSAVTIVYSGDNTAGYTHAPTDTSHGHGSGTIDIMAPTSGSWSGVAMYQDPRLTVGMDISAAGNSPTWDITGLVYLPHSSVTFSGAVNKSSNGQACFVMVVDNVTINGTGNILSQGGCASAGLLNLPVSQWPSRGQLVL